MVDDVTMENKVSCLVQLHSDIDTLSLNKRGKQAD
jgi:hypothetical protein